MTATFDYVPNFFVVGAPKAGTTAVFNWLQEHPDVFLPSVKEPGYFAYAGQSAEPLAGPYDPDYYARITVDSRDYGQLYAQAGVRLTGDVSPVYLVQHDAAARIARARPDARIIILLRDPVDRAFSQYLHHVRDGLEPAPCFEMALEQETARLHAGWSWGHGYATHGHYARQIERYLDVFSRDQILFLDFAHLNAEPANCWHQICAHLRLRPTEFIRNARVNVTSSMVRVTGRPAVTHALRHPGLAQRMLKPLLSQGVRARLRHWLEGNSKPVPLLQQMSRNRLSAQFAPEYAQIEAQTGLSLGHWTQVHQ